MRSVACSWAVSAVLLLGTACATSEAPSEAPFQASDCDALWSKLQPARTKAQTYSIDRFEGLSDEEIAQLPGDPEEQRLHARVDRAYEAWQAAGCGR